MQRMLVFFLVIFGSSLLAQSQLVSDSLPERITLQNCVRYALSHQPSVRESRVDEDITERTIQGKLADWYPQVNLNFNVQHNLQIPVAIVGGLPLNQGLANNSNIQFVVTQTLFNKDVLLASSSATDVRSFAKQRTMSTSIDVVVNVSKAYYATLVTQQQIELLDEAILRLEQSSKDAFKKYQGGIVDKTDYMRAQIALNNAKADRKQSEELLKVRFANLKEQMGYSTEAKMELDFDRTQMEREALTDTSTAVNYNDRIEFQLLQTQKRLQEDNLNYYEWGFIPSINVFGGYSMNYQSSFVDQLYNRTYPISFIGLQLSFPLFQGGKRIQEIKQAKLQLDRIDYDFLSLKNSMNSQYAAALANYKSNLNFYKVLSDNLQLAQDVYRTIQLQYKDGTKSYLEYITAETDLRTAQVNQTDALYQLLAGKLDLQKATGTVSY